MNVYDFDGTIYSKDSSIEFYLFVLRKNFKLIQCLPKQLFGILLYKIGRINKTEMKEYYFSFLKKIDAEREVEQFWAIHEKYICEWYREQRTESDIVISASPEFLLKPICDALNVKYLIGSNVDQYTGKFTGSNCKGEEKVRRLREYIDLSSIDNFYSDSISDQPLANYAKNAYRIKNGNIYNWI